MVENVPLKKLIVHMFIARPKKASLCAVFAHHRQAHAWFESQANPLPDRLLPGQVLVGLDQAGQPNIPRKNKTGGMYRDQQQFMLAPMPVYIGLDGRVAKGELFFVSEDPKYVCDL